MRKRPLLRLLPALASCALPRGGDAPLSGTRVPPPRENARPRATYRPSVDASSVEPSRQRLVWRCATPSCSFAIVQRSFGLRLVSLSRRGLHVESSPGASSVLPGRDGWSIRDFPPTITGDPAMRTYTATSSLLTLSLVSMLTSFGTVARADDAVTAPVAAPAATPAPAPQSPPPTAYSSAPPPARSRRPGGERTAPHRACTGPASGASCPGAASASARVS